MFKFIRVTILLFILLGVVIGYFNDAKQTQWNEPLWVTIYPINGDSSTITQTYIDALDSQDFKIIGLFIDEEAKYWKLTLTNPIVLNVSSQIDQLPPIQSSNTPLSNIIYSLHLRFWAWKNANTDLPEDIRIFVQFFNPDDYTALSHSIGIRKGKLGLVNAFASKRQHNQNLFIIAHELLHTLGAKDKYDVNNNQPNFPEGFANPLQKPLYPQSFAEIMGGRIPVSDTNSVTPKNLNKVVVGKMTAEEIGWLDL